VGPAAVRAVTEAALAVLAWAMAARAAGWAAVAWGQARVEAAAAG
jgi:hypothetical protein